MMKLFNLKYPNPEFLIKNYSINLLIQYLIESKELN